MIADEWNIKIGDGEWFFTILHWNRAVELTLTAIPAQEKAVIIEHYVKMFGKSLGSDVDDRLKAMSEELAGVTKTLGDMKAAEGVDPEPATRGEDDMNKEEVLKAVGDQLDAATEKDARFGDLSKVLKAAISGEAFPEEPAPDTKIEIPETEEAIKALQVTLDEKLKALTPEPKADPEPVVETAETLKAAIAENQAKLDALEPDPEPVKKVDPEPPESKQDVKQDVNKGADPEPKGAFDGSW